MPARDAAQTVATALKPSTASLILFFISPSIDPDVFTAALHAAAPGTPLIGCTSAGGCGPDGFGSSSVAAISFPADDFCFVHADLRCLRDFDPSQVQAQARRLVERLEDRAPDLDRRDMFALQLIDGLSVREERLTRAHQAALVDIPILGGSAGDDLRFERTRVYNGTEWLDDGAVLVLGASRRPYSTFLVQSFSAGPRRMIVTRADEASRTVFELDGAPATEVYAAACGLSPEELTPSAFGAAPVVVLIGGSAYVRAIREAGQDGSLVFYGAIEEGMVLRVATAGDLIENSQRCMEQLREKLGPVEAVLGFQCSLQIEALRAASALPALHSVLEPSRALVLGTYGEQYRGVHMNQAFVGIAFAKCRRESLP